MQKSIYVTLLLFVICSGAFCQGLSKKQLSALLKPDKEDSERNWVTCNQDSTFFKSDTVRLYDNINYFYQLSSCCDFVEWHVYKKEGFSQGRSQICKEPASASVISDFFKFSIWKSSKKIYLTAINPKTHDMQIFEFVSLSKIKLANNNYASELIFVKMFSPKPIVGRVI